MLIKTFGCEFSDNGVGFSLPAGSNAQIEMTESKMLRNGVAIEERDDPLHALCDALGLPRGTDKTLLAELFREVKDRRPEEMAATVQRSGLLARLGLTAAHAIGLVSNIVTVMDSPRYAQALQMLEAVKAAW